jgi:hypothetical protein
MLETIIVNTVLIPLLASVPYFWAAYGAKIGGMENARAAAWTYAYGGCQEEVAPGTLGLDPVFGTPTLATEPGTNTLSDLTGIGKPVPGTGTSLDGQGPYLSIFDLPGYGTVLASVTSVAPGQPILGITAKSMPLTSHVRCNAVPEDATAWITSFGTLHP